MKPAPNAFSRIRGLLELSQGAFAAALSVNQSTVSRWERGELRPGHGEMETMRGLLRAKGVRWQDRWFFEPPEPRARKNGVEARP